MTKRDEAKLDYLAGMKYKEIADKYGVSESTVKQWKRRYWSDNDVTKPKKVTKKVTQKVTPKEKLHPAIQELDESGLNDRQKRFAMDVVRISNQTQAYINAYDCDYETARVNASRLLTNANIQKEIKRLRQARLSELGIGVFDLLDDIAKEARADIRDFADWGSNEFETIDEESGKQYTKHKSWVALKNSDSVDSKAVKKITVGKDGPQVEMQDRNKARDKLLEYLRPDGTVVTETSKQRKERAEADIAESKARLLADSDDKVVDAVETLMNAFSGEAKEEADD